MKVFESINTIYYERSAVVLYILVFKIRNLSLLLSSTKQSERVPLTIITGRVTYLRRSLQNNNVYICGAKRGVAISNKTTNIFILFLA